MQYFKKAAKNSNSHETESKGNFSALYVIIEVPPPTPWTCPLNPTPYFIQPIPTPSSVHTPPTPHLQKRRVMMV